MLGHPATIQAMTKPPRAHASVSCWVPAGSVVIITHAVEAPEGVPRSLLFSVFYLLCPPSVDPRADGEHKIIMQSNKYKIRNT